MTVTKEQLTERKRGKGGTIVYARGQRLVVKDLMTRKNYDRPGRIGVGPEDRGYAFSVELDEVTLA
jgi:hypothetical protein